jgi:integrase
MLTVELRHLLETQWTEHERLAKAERISPYVFSRTALVKQPDGTWQKLEGQPIRSFIKAWRAACARAGFPGRIPHDLRRSAIRTFVRKGLSENTAMALSGHKTSSVFRRYDIVSAGDLDAAAEKLDAPDVQDAQDAARPAKIRSIRRA